MILKINKPKVGDRRIKRRFALLPQRIDADSVVWMQWYYDIEKYYDCFVGPTSKKKYFWRTLYIVLTHEIALKYLP